MERELCYHMLFCTYLRFYLSCSYVTPVHCLATNPSDQSDVQNIVIDQLHHTVCCYFLIKVYHKLNTERENMDSHIHSIRHVLFTDERQVVLSAERLLFYTKSFINY